MNRNFIEAWEEFPDDWYDGADEMLRRAHIILLETCLMRPSACKYTDQNPN